VTAQINVDSKGSEGQSLMQLCKEFNPIGPEETRKRDKYTTVRTMLDSRGAMAGMLTLQS
jgi:hypothetical protein